MLHLHLVWEVVGSEAMITVDPSKISFVWDSHHVLAVKNFSLILTENFYEWMWRVDLWISTKKNLKERVECDLSVWLGYCPDSASEYQPQKKNADEYGGERGQQ